MRDDRDTVKSERERGGERVGSMVEKVPGQGCVEFVHGFLAAFGAALIIQTIRTCLKTCINYTFIANWDDIIKSSCDDAIK